MSEEMNMRAAGLSEAELASVSGGVNLLLHRAKDVSRRLCNSCDRGGSCGVGQMALQNYIYDNGTLDDWNICPFYDSAGKAGEA